MFIYRIKKYIGAYIHSMGGVDAIVFTGGIGQNNKHVMHECTKNLDFLRKKPKVIQIRTDEELMIAREVRKLIK